VGGKQKRSVGVAVRVRLAPKWPRFGRFLHIFRYYLRQNEHIYSIFIYFTNLKSEKFGDFGIVTPIPTIPVRENSEVLISDPDKR
jgi:hypothetical protein